MAPIRRQQADQGEQTTNIVMEPGRDGTQNWGRLQAPTFWLMATSYLRKLGLLTTTVLP